MQEALRGEGICGSNDDETRSRKIEFVSVRCETRQARVRVEVDCYPKSKYSKSISNTENGVKAHVCARGGPENWGWII